MYWVSLINLDTKDEHRILKLLLWERKVYVLALRSLRCFWCTVSSNEEIKLQKKKSYQISTFTFSSSQISFTGGLNNIKRWPDSFVIHYFFPQLFLSLGSWKRKQTSYWSKVVFFSQFVSWKRNHNKYSLKKFVDSEFEIG